jgi:hypothetical protein
VRLERLGKFKNPTTWSGIDSGTFPCGIVPERTTLPHAPRYIASLEENVFCGLVGNSEVIKIFTERSGLDPVLKPEVQTLIMKT